MKENDLKDILGLSRNVLSTVKKKLFTLKLLIKDENGNLMIDKRLCFKCEVNKKYYGKVTRGFL